MSIRWQPFRVRIRRLAAVESTACPAADPGPGRPAGWPPASSSAAVLAVAAVASGAAVASAGLAAGVVVAVPDGIGQRFL